MSKEEQEWFDKRPPVPSNARVLEYREKDGYGIVICDLGFRRFSQSKREYVTWSYRIGDTGVGAGHYFSDLESAARHYKERPL